MPSQHLKQRADGRYRVKYHDHYFYGATEREACQARDAYIREEEAGIRHDAARMTVRQYAAEWLPVHKHGVATRTYNDYANQLNRLLDVIGDMPLQDVHPTDSTPAGRTHGSADCGSFFCVLKGSM